MRKWVVLGVSLFTGACLVFWLTTLRPEREAPAEAERLGGISAEPLPVEKPGEVTISNPPSSVPTEVTEKREVLAAAEIEKWLGCSVKGDAWCEGLILSMSLSGEEPTSGQRSALTTHWKKVLENVESYIHTLSELRERVGSDFSPSQVIEFEKQLWLARRGARTGETPERLAEAQAHAVPVLSVEGKVSSFAEQGRQGPD